MPAQLYKVHNYVICLNLPEVIELSKLQAHIPSIIRMEYVNHHHNDDYNNIIHINFIESEMFEIQESKGSIHIYAIWNDIIKNDMPHLVYGILRKIWIENGYYPIHSICFENSLLIGHSGNGKTTLALSAIKKNCKVFSFDKTLVNFNDLQLVAQSGTQVLSIRKQLYEKECIDNAQVLNFEILSYGERIVLQAPISENSEDITKIYLFYLNDIPLVKQKLTSLSSLHELYSFFLDSTKNDVIINNGQYVFDGNISMGSKQNLTESLKKWLSSNHKVEVLIGNKDDIVDYVRYNNVIC